MVNVPLNESDYDDLITRIEAAGIMKCSTETVRRRQKDGLPVVFSGRKPLYPRRGVRLYLQLAEQATSCPKQEAAGNPYQEDKPCHTGAKTGAKVARFTQSLTPTNAANELKNLLE